MEPSRSPELTLPPCLPLPPLGHLPGHLGGTPHPHPRTQSPAARPPSRDCPVHPLYPTSPLPASQACPTRGLTFPLDPVSPSSLLSLPFAHPPVPLGPGNSDRVPSPTSWIPVPATELYPHFPQPTGPSWEASPHPACLALALRSWGHPAPPHPDPGETPSPTFAHTPAPVTPGPGPPQGRPPDGASPDPDAPTQFQDPAGGPPPRPGAAPCPPCRGQCPRPSAARRLQGPGSRPEPDHPRHRARRPGEAPPPGPDLGSRGAPFPARRCRPRPARAPRPAPAPGAAVPRLMTARPARAAAARSRSRAPGAGGGIAAAAAARRGRGEGGPSRGARGLGGEGEGEGTPPAAAPARGGGGGGGRGWGGATRRPELLQTRGGGRR